MRFAMRVAQILLGLYAVLIFINSFLSFPFEFKQAIYGFVVSFVSLIMVYALQHDKFS